MGCFKNVLSTVQQSQNQPTSNKCVCFPFLMWILHYCFKWIWIFPIKKLTNVFTKGVFFFRERLLSRFKTAFNIAILQTQYASYWSFLLNTYIFNCETRQNLSLYLYGNILLSSQEYNRNYIYHQKYCNLCMLCYMFWCNHVQNTHMDKLFNTE